jgi:hypothetical protein
MNEILLFSILPIGIIAAIIIVVRVALYYSEKGRKMAGNDTYVVIFFPDSKEELRMPAEDYKGLIRIANKYPKAKYRIMRDNKFSMSKPVRFLKHDIQKGVI